MHSIDLKWVTRGDYSKSKLGYLAVGLSLTELGIKAAKAQDKPYKLYDEKGLFLLVTPTGGRLWRLKYKHGGVEKQTRSAHDSSPRTSIPVPNDAAASARCVRGSSGMP